MVQWRGKWMGSAEPGPDLLGLLARVLVDSTKGLIRNHLGRAHTQCRAVVSGIRGRIDFGESLRRLSFEEAKTYCRFPELTINTPKNRIIRSTLNRLRTDSRVFHARPEETAKLRHDIRNVVRAMEGVELAQIAPSAFSRLQLGRNDREYALPIAICTLIRRLQMPTEHSGDDMFTTLLRDEILFHDLFERFVRNFYSIRLKHHEVKRETLTWHDELGSERVPTMRTDITIIGKAPSARRLIIDTKYSIATLVATPHGGLKFKSENLYQIYAYLRTQEHLSHAHRVAEGMLLYPVTSEHVDETMSVQGHRIRVATVDLAAEWSEIETRLLGLVDAEVD